MPSTEFRQLLHQQFHTKIQIKLKLSNNKQESAVSWAAVSLKAISSRQLLDEPFLDYEF